MLTTALRVAYRWRDAEEQTVRTETRVIQSIFKGRLFGLWWLLTHNESHKILKGQSLSSSDHSDIHKVRKFVTMTKQTMSDFWTFQMSWMWQMALKWCANLFLKGMEYKLQRQSVCNTQSYTHAHLASPLEKHWVTEKLQEYMGGWAAGTFLCVCVFPVFFSFFSGAQRVQEILISIHRTDRQKHFLSKP